jgi:hypothetical protein
MKARMGTNIRKVPPGANRDRANGASRIATSLNLDVLEHAAAFGNRATRRLALRNLRRRGVKS